MISVICDVCKKQIPNAQREKNYWTILDKSLCKQCKREVEDKVAEKMFSKPRYQFKAYQKTTIEVLEKVCR